MFTLDKKQVLVIGLGSRGRAACELLRWCGANVIAVDEANTADLRAQAGKLRPLGVEVELGVVRPPDRHFSLAVLSPAVPGSKPIVQEMLQRHVPVIGEFELGYQQSQCLNLTVAGSWNRAVTAKLIGALLQQNQRRIALCGRGWRPVCALAPSSRELDFLILEADPLELEATHFFRPSVAVVTDLEPGAKDDAFGPYVHLFQNQQPFDWAIVQSEALARLRDAGVKIPSKIITFSAQDRRADIRLDRGLLISSLPGWSGPLLNLDRCRMHGLDSAESLMAALAAGHVLHVSLGAMADVLTLQPPVAHCFEQVTEVKGVRFINDSRSTNCAALQRALLSVGPGHGGAANVWLIAGGRDEKGGFSDVAPLISQRLKGAILTGEAREKIRAAWSSFTPCTPAGTLLEAVQIAAANAMHGDVILFSPACSSFDQFRNFQHRGEVFRDAVKGLATPSGGGAVNGHRDTQAESIGDWRRNDNIGI